MVTVQATVGRGDEESQACLLFLDGLCNFLQNVIAFTVLSLVGGIPLAYWLFPSLNDVHVLGVQWELQESWKDDARWLREARALADGVDGIVVSNHGGRSMDYVPSTLEVLEEIVQEVFLRLWLNAETLVPELSLRSYLFTIARNLSFDFLRKAANSRKLREEIFYSGSALHDRTQEELIHAEYDLLRKKAIETLPPKRRRIYTLSREEGMSYEDISRELGISISTVKTQMSKALQSMKEYLQLNTDLTFLLALALQIGADWNF